ncbi:Uncharacterised protein [Kingella potus]|uniref:Uncharacterized protein n=1 Tax=Kingella potus TaxID=265175 RepID=A0A377QYH1_9NEIS|nr:hypothetical protein [Kingella potus]STQ99845.1 Uncharacterised protein [Kingella potus]
MNGFSTLLDWITGKDSSEDPIYHAVKIILGLGLIALAAWLGSD